MTEKSVFFFFLFLFFFLSTSSGLVVGPAKTVDSNYEPGADREYVFSVYNDAMEDIVVVPTVGGELADSVKLERGKERFMISANQKSDVKVSFTVPLRLSPGEHRFDIAFRQVPKQGVVGVGATVTIFAVVVLEVPAPPKFVLVEMKPINSSKPGEPIVMNALLKHLGSDVIDRVTGYFEVKKNSDVVKKLPIQEVKLFLPLEEKIITTSLDTVNLSVGTYAASVYIEYDGVLTNSTPREFYIGEQRLVITDFAPREFAPEVSAVTLKVKNLWNEDIQAKVLFQFNESKVKEINAQNAGDFIFPALSEKTINTFLDAKGVSDGNYLVGVTALFQESSTQKEFEITVKKSAAATASQVQQNATTAQPGKEQELSGSLLLLFALAVILILAALVLILLKKR